MFVGRWLAGAYQKGKIVLLHTRHEVVPQVMGRNGRQRRMGALLTVVTAMFAVLLMMAGMTTPALAAEQHAAVTINAERVAAGEYRLTITTTAVKPSSRQPVSPPCRKRFSRMAPQPATHGR